MLKGKVNREQTIEFRCRVALLSALFIIRRRIFGSGYS